ncbi:glycosyltransferase family 2 protein [Flavobacterium cheongpyeongense]|uniref:Glycosyltransferase family 2 protein n=1 Tax=Flavobacterium cheongpyeongense TaxID=2212651 RepID=A0A2V4BTX7_9FLAO|nr:glycosyltransferase family A protein [Flavobacterium cheongpyeongense]PXY42022.1 glycosyltransferase family 2 protein [Flavobacterium cheongpyeongense]
MIIVYHENNKVIGVNDGIKKLSFSDKNIAVTLFEIAIAFPEELVIWCHSDFKSNLNVAEFHTIFHHQKIMASYNPFQNSFLSDAIGYVEESPFLNINKNVIYPTWLMSSSVGGIHASVLLALKEDVKVSYNLDYFLYSLAKLAMPHGLFCYSEPQLLCGIKYQNKIHKNSNFILFRFVKQHYKTRWIFLLFLNFLLYKNRIALLPLFYSFLYSQRKLKDNLLEKIDVQSTKRVVELGTVDVIIPTIGRKEYLYDVLKDLAKQTHLPKNVIIVEQNPNPDSVSELDYLENEIWNFDIKHIFTHQAGACNARNLALAEVKSEWVFMADDDIRIDKGFLDGVFLKINQFGVNVLTLACYEEGYSFNKKLEIQMQWSSFGSGCSMVKKQFLEDIKYNKRFEFGYGEDSDFGMQLRNLGTDILYFPNPEIIHLKAPIGGFRTKPVLAWQKDVIQPKPSPTVMLYKILHLNEKQIKGYKTILFLKFYKKQSIKNPIRYFSNFKKQWKRSLYWANQLRNQE